MGGGWIGRQIGNYRMAQLLGQGGMGSVFAAENVHLGGRFAVKILNPELSKDRDVAGRFLNEARASARLRHPGIVTIFDFGQLDDGTLYLVMEHLAGESLAARLRRGAIAGPELISLARQMAGAL